MHEFKGIVRVVGVEKLKLNAPNPSSNSYNMWRGATCQLPKAIVEKMQVGYLTHLLCHEV
jgi:hypothetical protein